MTTELRRASAPDTPQFQAELGRWLAASTRQTTRQAGRLGRRRGAMLALAGLVALGLVAVPVLGPRPRDTAVARSFKLANGTVIGIEEFMDARNFPRLRQQFANAGATLVIDEIPVNDRAIGRVFSIQMDADRPPAANADPSGVRVAAGERVEVTVGRRARPDERVTTEGLTLFEVFPKVEQAIIRDDAVATGRGAASIGLQGSMGADRAQPRRRTGRPAHEGNQDRRTRPWHGRAVGARPERGMGQHRPVHRHPDGGGNDQPRGPRAAGPPLTPGHPALGRMAVPGSVHQPTPDSTQAVWLDSTPDLSSMDSTRGHAVGVDHQPCKQQVGVRAPASFQAPSEPAAVSGRSGP
jgi:hypothetical protein